MQEAFQQGYTNHFGPEKGIVLPYADIESSFNTEGAVAYEVVDENTRKRFGGCIVVISKDGKAGSLHLLYTKVGCQNKGVASFLWKGIETKYPSVSKWETHTPYFDTRNIHFYVNRCGFHIVEYFNKYHPEPDDHFSGEGIDPTGSMGMFRFEKKNQNRYSRMELITGGVYLPQMNVGMAI